MKTTEVNKNLIGRRCECIFTGMMVTGVIEDIEENKYSVNVKVHFDKPAHRGRLCVHDSRLVGPQELRRRDWPELLLRGYTHQRLRSQALRTRRVARYPLPDTYSQRHKELADSGTLHLDRRGGFGQFACHAPFAGHRRGRRSGRSIGYQAVQKRCSQYRCRFPAQTAAGRRTIFQIISSVSINLFFH